MAPDHIQRAYTPKRNAVMGRHRAYRTCPGPSLPLCLRLRFVGLCVRDDENGGVKTGGDTPSSGPRKGCAGTSAGEGQGCIRRGGGGGGGLRGGGGGGFGWDPPSSQSPAMVSAAWGPKKLNPLGARGVEANFCLSASSIGRGGRGV